MAVVNEVAMNMGVQISPQDPAVECTPRSGIVTSCCDSIFNM